MDDADGWVELESDPGLFTLLVEDFGVRGVEVEEVYDLQKPLEKCIHGCIFLFKYPTNRRRRKALEDAMHAGKLVTDDATMRSMFFAHQTVSGSCATHALLSILLNCENIDLGNVLTQFKELTRGMPPESKGCAIGNVPELADAHNKHARPDAIRQHYMQSSSGKHPVVITSSRCSGSWFEQFHFTSFVPIGGRLYELDGLKEYPVDHGTLSPDEDWTEALRKLLVERIKITQQIGEEEDIRYNLMAVVPSKLHRFKDNYQLLENNLGKLLGAMEKLVLTTQTSFLRRSHEQLLALLEMQRAGRMTDLAAATERLGGSCTVLNMYTCGPAFLSQSFGGDCSSITASAGAADVTGCASTSSWTQTMDAHEIARLCLTSPVLHVSCHQPSGCAELKTASGSLSNGSLCIASPAMVRLIWKPRTEGAYNVDLSPDLLLAVAKLLLAELEKYRQLVDEEKQRRQQYMQDDVHRTHNYDPFIRTFLTMLVQHGIVLPSGGSTSVASRLNGHSAVRGRSAYVQNRSKHVKKLQTIAKHRANRRM